MRLLRRFLLYIILLASVAFPQISYDIFHSNLVISYTNRTGVSTTRQFYFTNYLLSTTNTNGGGWYTTNASDGSNRITVRELPVDHFVLTTNGGTINAGSNFTLGLKAVDAYGYHVTITNATNITFASLNTSYGVTTTNLSLTNYPFVSPTVTTPDFTGVTITNSYPEGAIIYISAQGYTNTNIQVYTNYAGIFTNIPLGFIEIVPPAGAGIVYFDRSNYLGYGTYALVTVNDADRNSNYTGIDAVTVDLSSDAFGGWKQVVLYETGISTGIFTNSILLFNVSNGATDNMFVTNNSLLYADYLDTGPVITNTNTALFKEIMSIVVNNPYFIQPSLFTNVMILGVDDANNTNDITDTYLFGTVDTSIINVVSSNYIATLVPGLGVLSASNIYDQNLSTNITFLVTVPPGQAAVFTTGDATASVPTNGWGDEVYVDLRDPDDWGTTYPSMTNLTADILTADGGIGQGDAVLDDKSVLLSAIISNLADNTNAPAEPISLVFNYDSSDLVLGDGRVIQENDLRVVYLDDSGGTYEWIDVTNFTIDTSTRTITAVVYDTGVYTLMSRTTRVPDDLAKVQIYPNPVDYSLLSTVNFINLPADTQEIRIFRVNGKLIRTISAAKGDIGVVDVEGISVHGAQWDGYDDEGEMVGSGLYLVQVITDSKTEVFKLGVKNNR